MEVEVLLKDHLLNQFSKAANTSHQTENNTQQAEITISSHIVELIVYAVRKGAILILLMVSSVNNKH